MGIIRIIVVQCIESTLIAGPAFLDYLTIVQIVAAHPMIFLLLHVSWTPVVFSQVARNQSRVACESCPTT